MKINFTQLSFLIIIVFSACKKDKEVINTTSTSPQYYTFSGRIGTNDNSTVITNDNNIAICGNLNNNICLLKISKSGTLIWRKDFSFGNNEFANSLVETSDGNLLIVGYTARNFQLSNWDIFVVKVSQAGDTLWTKTYGWNGSDNGREIIKTNDNNYLIASTTFIDTNSFSNISLIKINSDGDTIWTKIYPDQNKEIPKHILQTQNGEYLITGSNEDGNQQSGLHVLKVDENGNKLWSKTSSVNPQSWGQSTIELTNGDLITCGQRLSNTGYSQIFLVKSDYIGNEIWNKEVFASPASESANSIKINLDGTYSITGFSLDVVNGIGDIVLMKIDQNGNVVWNKKFGGDGIDWGTNLVKDNNGDNIITGTTQSFGSSPSGESIYMIKTDNNGNFK